MAASLKPVLELDAGMPMEQFRFTPMKLGDTRGFLAIHSNCDNIDPWPPYFVMPTDTLKLTAFTEDGRRLWHMDVGPGIVPGIWFCPVMAFDLDGDGVDEVFLLRNSSPEHPLDATRLTLDRLSGCTGELLDSRPWPKVKDRQPLSHLWRNFINVAFDKGDPRLITAQGTYGPMHLQCWDRDFHLVWERKIDPEKSSGPLGSHMFPVLDIDGDGRDELFWGDRCIDIDTGQDIWVADQAGWRGHSDIVQPTLDLKTGKWLIYTCRESTDPAEARGVVMFDDHGRELWGVRGLGHMHDGWVGRLCDDGSHLCYAYDASSRKHYCFDTQGRPRETGFSLEGTLPVDFDGDGLHELVYTNGDSRGLVIDRHGREIARLEGEPAYGARILGLPGEQIVTWPRGKGGGTIRIYAMPSAADSPAARRRYRHPFYAACLRIWAVGYNWRNLPGL